MLIILLLLLFFIYSFLGWCTGTNSIRLALDLRNEASNVTYGTTRYATDFDVKEVLTKYHV